MGLPGFTNVADRQSLALSPAGVPYVAYSDGDHNGKISVKKYEDLTINITVPQSADFQLKIYPNPSTGKFTLEFKEGSRYQILNVSGQVVKTGKLDADRSANNLNYQSISCDELNAGFYFVRVIGESGFQTLKFLKQ